MADKLHAIEKEIAKIRERNQKVEANKAWETSWTRRIFIGVSTYFLIAVFLIIIKAQKPFISAIIPALAYLISTLSLGLLRNWWVKRQKR